MKYINALLIIVVIGISASVFLYIYPQESGQQEKVGSQTRYSGKVLQKNAVESISESETSENASVNATQTTAGRSASSPAKSNQSAKRESISEDSKNIITKYFLQDLSEYILEQFYPPQSKNNPHDTAKSNLSFKAVNARYGLQLTGLRHESNNLDRARQEILNKVLNPERLNLLYSRYSDEFLNILQQAAKSKEYAFVGENGGVENRKLKPAHIGEMFDLNSEYLQDIASVYNVLASKSLLSDLMDKYLRFERLSRDVYVQESDNSTQHSEETIGNITESGSGRREVGDRMKLSEQQYENVLQKREKFRNKILGEIKMEVPELGIADREVLEIAKWVYRRREQGTDNAAILEVGKILDGLSAKMEKRAENIQNSS